MNNLTVDRDKWDGKHPLNSDWVRETWKNCVKEEFGKDVYEGKESSIHLKWMNVEEDKNRVLHKLKYKARPPLIDLSRYMNKFDRKDGNKVNFEKHKKMLQLLINSKNQTRLFGFWTRLKYYSVPDVEEFEGRCMLCGGGLEETHDGIEMEETESFKILKETKTKFKIIKPPPG